MQLNQRCMASMRPWVQFPACINQKMVTYDYNPNIQKFKVIIGCIVSLKSTWNI